MKIIERLLGKKEFKLDFLVVGSQKAGTSSLFNFLSLHPQCGFGSTKEIHYFDTNYDKGETWYHNHFNRTKTTAKKYFEVTPSYIYFPWVPERISAYNNKIKLIVVLRDPIERAYSAWNMWRIAHREKKKFYLERFSVDPREHTKPYLDLFRKEDFPSFNETILDEIEAFMQNEKYSTPDFVKRGIYVQQFENFYKHFSCDQFLVINSQDLMSSKIKVLKKVEQFLGISSFDWYKKNLVNNHVRGYDSLIDVDSFSALQEFYKPYNEELFKLLDTDFGWNKNKVNM